MAVQPTTPLLIYPLADLSVATILPYTINSSGNLVAASTGAFAGGAKSMLGYLDSIVLRIDQMLLEAISVDAGYMNRLPTVLDAAVGIIENRRRQAAAGAGGANANDPGEILALATAFPVAKVVWAYNKGTVHNDVVTFFGMWNQFGSGIQGLGIQKASLNLSLFDTSAVQVDGTAGVVPISMVRA